MREFPVLVLFGAQFALRLVAEKDGVAVCELDVGPGGRGEKGTGRSLGEEMEGVEGEGEGVGRGEVDVGGGMSRAVAGGAVVGLCPEGVALVLVG